MFVPALRHTAAQLMTRGRLDLDADEIQRALEAASGRAVPAKIEAIVSHATIAVPFYREFHGAQLHELPVVDKTTMRPDVTAFLSEGFDRSALKRRSTSGSTGIPFTVYLEAARETRNRASAVSSIRYAGGDAFASSVRTRAWAKPSAKDRVLNVLKGDYAHNGDHFDSEPIREIAQWIRRRKGVILQGYASYLERIFRVMEEGGERFEPGTVGAVISGAEAPTPYLNAASLRLFGVSAHARYSNMELGVMSTSAHTSITDYKFDFSTFHLEILREDSDEAAAPGEAGRVVVTDLHNHAMPLLRYDTGDLGRFAVSPSGTTLPNVLTDVQGRRLDVLVAGTPEKPHRAHPLAIWGPVAKVDGIRQFQLRQHDVGRFTWVLNADPSAEIEAFLRGVLDERIGDMLSCEFRYVDEVPVMQSGKRQFFVNEIPEPMKMLGIEG